MKLRHICGGMVKVIPVIIWPLTELVADREIDIGMAFNISHASNAILANRLPKTIRSYIHEKGTLANTHFLTIPYNSSNIEAAKIFINFLISPYCSIKKTG
jgi:putative thiamine transport system substrate-binding protein